MGIYYRMSVALSKFKAVLKSALRFGNFLVKMKLRAITEMGGEGVLK